MLPDVNEVICENNNRAFLGFSALLVVAGAGVANVFIGWW